MPDTQDPSQGHQAMPGPATSAAPAGGEGSPAPARRVAVVVVHGVADQAPGATARAFIEMMVAAGGRDGAQYQALGSEAFTLAVPVPAPLPRSTSGAEAAAAAGAADALPTAAPDAAERGAGKALRQSWVSDFHHHGLDKRADEDAGLAFTNYLVSKAHRHRVPATTYASERHLLARQGRSGATQIDVHELYWADLSRLSGSAPQIVTEVFTLIFRLSRLARDTVERASVGGGWAWELLRRAQTSVDWIFTNVLAQLFALLLGLGLYLGAVGLLTAGSTKAVAVTQGLALVLGFFGLLALAYFGRATAPRERASPRMLLLAWVVVAVAAVLLWQPAPSVAPVVLALLVAVYLAGLRAGNLRFPFVWHSGVALLSAMLLFTAARLLWFREPAGAAWTPRDFWLDAGMTGLEAVLVAIKFVWALLATLIVVWALLSLGLSAVAWARNDLARRASAATGRLGLLLSLTTLLVVTMALWSAVSWAVTQPLAGHSYEPFYWRAEAAAAGNALALTDGKAQPSGEPSSAGAGSCRFGDAAASRPSAAFVNCRYLGTTQTFPVIVLLLMALGVYLVATVLPSLLAELRLVRSSARAEARRLGLWLTVCYRWLDRMVALITALAALAAVAVVAWWWAEAAGQTASLPGWMAQAAAWMAEASQQWLAPLTITATSALAALTLLGRVLSRALPGLRAPLDVALDVDNYMREFPRKGIPRVRMLARGLALFDHLAARGYDRVVVVAHSQGTVLASETLRWMASHSLQAAQTGRAEHLKARLRCASVRLLTLGSPLRQLYAARFPKLYAWVLADHAGRNGPRADDVGVERWANAFGSGDYVGRWLWARSVQPPRKYHPLIDDLEPGLGRALAYDAFEPMPPDAAALSGRAEFETCVGYDAHTHYFDPPEAAGEPQVVALLADDLIALP